MQHRNIQLTQVANLFSKIRKFTLLTIRILLMPLNQIQANQWLFQFWLSHKRFVAAKKRPKHLDKIAKKTLPVCLGLDDIIHCAFVTKGKKMNERFQKRIFKSQIFSSKCLQNVLFWFFRFSKMEHSLGPFTFSSNSGCFDSENFPQYVTRVFGLTKIKLFK